MQKPETYGAIIGGLAGIAGGILVAQLMLQHYADGVGDCAQALHHAKGIPVVCVDEGFGQDFGLSPNATSPNDIPITESFPATTAHLLTPKAFLAEEMPAVEANKPYVSRTGGIILIMSTGSLAMFGAWVGPKVSTERLSKRPQHQLVTTH